jgi:hypothetical protein
MSWNESEILAARGSILTAAQDMLGGKLSYIEGARKIVAAGATARLDERDADLLPFVGIVSETDALPFGEMREYWQAAALDALQPEIDQKEAWAGGFGEPHSDGRVTTTHPLSRRQTLHGMRRHSISGSRTRRVTFTARRCSLPLPAPEIVRTSLRISRL